MLNHRSTGEVARLLGVSEPRLNDIVRRGKVDPPPEVVAGRRLWGPQHLRDAARSLGLLTHELEEKLSQEVPYGR